MSEQIRIDDLVTRGTELQTKFVYGMISIALGTLALSFQFSIKLKHMPIILISSWVILFISLLLGGWRIYILPSVFFANANILQNEWDISKFKQGPIYTSDRRQWTAEELHTAIDRRKKRVDRNTSEIEAINKIAKIIFKIQIGSLILGLFLLGFFTSLNYLKQI